MAALKKFRNGQARVLVATDIASRGLDVDGITHVINYELPHEPESYVHRIGRTARAGASGIAISLCDAGEHVSLRQIEKTICRSVTVFEDHPYHSHAVASMGRKSHAGNGAGHNRPAGHSARKPNPGRPNRFGGKNRGSSPKFRGRARAGR
ncbi:MAG: hypothetical protein COV67_11525 [Nitrospinae bacterium CG11_big_fil_rev_8_21_14_0_20_56_8]|nr:MAG: hypothetical protein COV67_11525 [Nitrospinae bacterium CG11_big_fil_rev_8_21_14_0_20_56_8]